jgi:hypothetical protein
LGRKFLIFYFKESPDIVKGGGGPHTNQEPTLYVGEVGRNNMQQQMLVGQEAGTQQPISLVV